MSHSLMKAFALSAGVLIAPGVLFNASRRPGTLMRINFATSQDARFWQRLQALI